MIRSEREYRETLRQIAEGRAFIEHQRTALIEQGHGPEEVKRGIDPLLSFQAGLTEEAAWYERVSRGQIDPIANLSQLGRLLIALRIKHGLTQSQLAERLGVSEAQVSKDERNEYHGIGVDRAQRIAEAMGETLTVGVSPHPDRELATTG
jgi:DNA-directed RNA polymerase specialized sigma subunit